MKAGLCQPRSKKCANFGKKLPLDFCGSYGILFLKEGDDLVKYSVEAGCCFCQECQYACPVAAITMDKNGAHIDREKCIGCGKCAKNCASEAIVKIEV